MGLGGFLVGGCLALFSAGFVLVNRSLEFAGAAMRETATAGAPTATPTASGFSSQRQTPTPILEAIDVAELLAEVEAMLEEDPQGVVELLEPALRAVPRGVDQAGAYYYLAQAEMMLGHYERGTGYYKQVEVSLSPLLDELATADEVGRAYSYLSAAALELGEYEEAMAYSQELVDKLTPMLNDLSDPEELANAYSYLGEAELVNGRFAFAAVYYRKVLEYERSAENIIQLAYVYDAGGNHACAYHWYLELLDWSGPEADEYRDYAREAVQFLEDSHAGPLPSCPE